MKSNEIGRVEALHDYGAGPILEIYIDQIGSTVLIPFTEKSVPNIDLKEKCIIIDPPEILK
jgi:16S rRNA processing protein RimM